MTYIDELLQHRAAHADVPATGGLSLTPARRLAVLTCMDARVMVERLLGLQPGQIQVLRNAGGIVTGDVLRSLVVATRMQGTREVMVLGHTDCGLQRFTDEQLRHKLQRELMRPVDPQPFYAFADVAHNVRWQVQKLHAAALLPPDIAVRGFVYDLHSGRLDEVTEPPRGDNVRRLVVHTRRDAEG